MIGAPGFGWSHISIQGKNLGWEDRMSYLDDVAFELLRAMIESCKEHRPVAVKFDAEGYEYILVIDWLRTYVIYQDSAIVQMAGFEEENSSFIALDAKREDLAKELIQDVRENSLAWATFCCDFEGGEEEAAKRETELLQLCRDLEVLLPADDYTLIYRKDGTEGHE